MAQRLASLLDFTKENTVDNQRMDELIGKLEEATTDGDLSNLNQDDIGDIYSWMLAQRGIQSERAILVSTLQDMRRMGQQQDDSRMANQAQALLTKLGADNAMAPKGERSEPVPSS